MQHPLVFMNLIMVYLSHFYGSNLWNLFNIENVCTAWNKIIRIVFDLPYRTHRYLLEPYSGFTHVLTMLTNRFMKFYSSLYYSSKNVVSNLRRCQENDCRSKFGLNTVLVGIMDQRVLWTTSRSLVLKNIDKKHYMRYSPYVANG